jgi:hypothetical protein
MPDRYAPERNMRVTGELTTQHIPAGALVLQPSDLDMLTTDECQELVKLLHLIETRRHADTIDATTDNDDQRLLRDR